MKKNLKKKLKYYLFSSMCLLMFLNSCQNDDELQNHQTSKTNDITLKNAVEIAKNLTLNSEFSKIAENKKIGLVFPLLTKEKETALYVINYQSGGFIILSADNRNSPILAYSENSSFKQDSLNYPEGLKDWLFFQTKNIEAIKIKNEPQSESIKQEWSSLNRLIEPSDPTVCPIDEMETVGPLLSTTWGQWTGYNTLVPYECIGNPSDRAPTGCVATAMAQIMRYHQKPSTYNWANMPNTFGTIDTAKLMRDIGVAVRMNYGCDGSGANSEDEIASTFRDDFHYSNASGGNYNYQTVVQQLRAKKPVILTGGRKKNDISWNMYTDGHAWVCDGFRSSTIYSYNEAQGSCLGTGYLRLHMNWGWGSGDNNYIGWYSFSNFNPGTYTFNYQCKMYYNIIP